MQTQSIEFEPSTFPALGSSSFRAFAHERTHSSARHVTSHERAAHATAIEDGLLQEEVDMILAGRRIIDAIPVRGGESPNSYAARAFSEMMVAYLA